MRSGASQAAVSRIERGRLDGMTFRTVDDVARAVGARLDVRLYWNGGDLDRLLDAGHAGLVEWMVRRLSRAGWTATPEVTFSVYGERGSIDILAFRPERDRPLVIEVKTTITDVQETISRQDRKSRIAPTLRVAARPERGPAAAGPADRLLVVLDSRTTRRRVAEHEGTFMAAYPRRGPAVWKWLRDPDEGPSWSGLVFAAPTHQVRGRQRQRVRGAKSAAVPRSVEAVGEGLPCPIPD